MANVKKCIKAWTRIGMLTNTRNDVVRMIKQLDLLEVRPRSETNPRETNISYGKCGLRQCSGADRKIPRT